MKKLKIVLCLVICVCCLYGCKSAPTNPAGAPEEEEAITEVSAEPEIYEAKLMAVGDIMVHSYQYEEAYNKETGKYDFMHNFEHVKKYFDAADYCIGNLETVFCRPGAWRIGFSHVQYPRRVFGLFEICGI